MGWNNECRENYPLDVGLGLIFISRIFQGNARHETSLMDHVPCDSSESVTQVCLVKPVGVGVPLRGRNDDELKSRSARCLRVGVPGSQSPAAQVRDTVSPSPDNRYRPTYVGLRGSVW